MVIGLNLVYNHVPKTKKIQLIMLIPIGKTIANTKLAKKPWTPVYCVEPNVIVPISKKLKMPIIIDKGPNENKYPTNNSLNKFAPVKPLQMTVCRIITSYF
tara:strand:+ start:300 stop:602 length:303 start_codon:yes stop_codon:yes gene_type:complete